MVFCHQISDLFNTAFCLGKLSVDKVDSCQTVFALKNVQNFSGFRDLYLQLE